MAHGTVFDDFIDTTWRYINTLGETVLAYAKRFPEFQPQYFAEMNRRELFRSHFSIPSDRPCEQNTKVRRAARSDRAP